MTSAEWIIQFLADKGVTDMFGLPGAIILDFLYAADAKSSVIRPHLCYHEQGCAMEACGYAQSTGRLGVAYSTRGPGFTNMLTGMADAYYDSIPAMFITAHSSASIKKGMRAEDNQEIDTVSIASNLTKYSVRIDAADDIPKEIEKAYSIAMNGRKGPVFLDILSSILRDEVSRYSTNDNETKESLDEYSSRLICNHLSKANRPVILIGAGVRQAGVISEVRTFAEKANIPVVSSRAAQDIMPDSEMYFGHIGSHGTRYSNFIMSKADLIVSLGNRLSFPVKSASFRPVVENAMVLRVETDTSEFQRVIPGSVSINSDLRRLLPGLISSDCKYANKTKWIDICREMRETLRGWDSIPVVDFLTSIMRKAKADTSFVCDVGNHGFWVTNAYAYSRVKNRIIYSNSFGSLGSGIPKAIGACCGSRAPVICFTGDQGFQLNQQELSLISKERIPITILVLNNESSGMILERERAKFKNHDVHTTADSGYFHPDFRTIAQAYEISYRCIENVENYNDELLTDIDSGPLIVEVKVEIDTKLYPNLPSGNLCQDLIPKLPDEIYRRMDSL